MKTLIYLIHFEIISVLGIVKYKPPDLDENNINSTVLTHEMSEVEVQVFDCAKSITQVSCQSFCSGDLIFEDNFDTLNWTKWRREIRIGAKSDDGEFVSYQNRPENCYVNNGYLHLMPSIQSEVPGFTERSIWYGTLDLRSDCWLGYDQNNQENECYHKAQNSQIIPPIVSARIRTKGTFEFLYGKVEVRAKLPKGDWIFPLILLEPSENFYGSRNYASGQLRVAFARGNVALRDLHNNDISGNYVQGGAVLSAGPTSQTREFWLRGTNRLHHSGDAFHVYALTWTDKYIALEIDGIEYARIPGGFKQTNTRYLPHATRWKQGDYMAPFDRKFFITLGLAVGGHSDFPEYSTNSKTNKKPWTNWSYKASSHYWNARHQWMRSLKKTAAGLHVDYVRVYAV